ncbi:MAG: class I SAM-dependent methyltransferase, partial [Candidatus Moranbacteria bacterium]|nr:class I SAM-dependent methyltransferase [Candidatus Moranbacteria bacterium]
KDPAIIVEIGSYKGKSTIWLSGGLKNNRNAKLYAVDSHQGSPEFIGEYKKINTHKEFKKNIERAGFAKIVIPIRKSSLQAAKAVAEKIDILFIDGSHTYAAVRNDFLTWSKKIKKGGWIILHDATVLTGPRKVAQKYILRSFNFRRTGMLGSMIYGQYSPAQNFSGKVAVLAQNLFSYLFIISYVIMRKMPFPQSLRRRWSKRVFRKQITRKDIFLGTKNYHSCRKFRNP